MRNCLIFLLLFAFSRAGVLPVRALADELEVLARDFWDWRAVTQPLSGDDIPRIERPVNWMPDWSRDARRLRGDKFSLADFHDFLWNNGNVPIALQRWESLGLRDEIERIGRLGAN